MKQKNKPWVCIICSQTFTRNSSAKRHNTNLHEGKGGHVRYIDYEIGRIQGKYFQNDPVLYKKKSTTKYDISDKQNGDDKLLSNKFIHNRSFGGYNDFPSSVINSKDKKSSRKTSLYDKVEEIMDFVDRIHIIANKILSEDEIKQCTKDILNPYFTNEPDAKTMVEERLDIFKKHIAFKRCKNYFSS
jgi:hypothetical protein